MDRPTMYLMLGYPGAGKTTTAQYLAGLTGAVHLNSDQFRVNMFKQPLEISEDEHEQMYTLLDYVAEIILKSGKSVVYDANLNKFEHRKQKYKIAKKTHAHAKLVWVRTNSIVAKKRATEEADKYPERRPFGNMDEKTFDRLVKGIELPKPEEDVIEVSGGNLSPQRLKEIFEEL